MWQRRGKGFDVQVYKGKSGNAERPHGLNAVPDMFWVKRRFATSGWGVYHKDLNTYPQDYYLSLDTNSGVVNASQWWKPPTSTHWFTATGGLGNVDAADYIVYLFSSVAGISKCDSYDGSNSTITITTGFQPRFIIIKRIDSGGSWLTWDTLRGWVSGNNNPSLALDTTAAQTTANGYTGGPISTGFTLNTNADYNGSGGKYLYYAHS